MPQVIETTVYQLDELSDAAKDKARNWYRDGGFDWEWYDSVYDDFEVICGILGIDLTRRPIKLMGGGTRQKPCIYFSGFWSQGDGACFEGIYRYKASAAAKIRDYAPKDTQLHDIADVLQQMQKKNFYQIHARAVHRGHYYHEYCMDVEVERDSPVYQALTSGAEEIVTTALRDLARWLYRSLQQEYEHQTSDEAVDEAITANEYTFTEMGKRFG